MTDEKPNCHFFFFFFNKLCLQLKYWITVSKCFLCQLPLLKSPEPKQDASHAPSTQQHLGISRSPKPPLWLTPGHSPPLTLEKEQAHPTTSGSEQARNLSFFSLPSGAARDPIKPCLNFFWLRSLIYFYCLSSDWFLLIKAAKSPGV